MENVKDEKQISFTNIYKCIANNIRPIGALIGLFLIIIGVIKFFETAGYYSGYRSALHDELSTLLVEIKSLLSLLLVAMGTMIDVLSLKNH